MTTTSPPDTRAARTALLELHRHLLHAERARVERFDGRMTATEFLMAAAEDLRFSWLTRLTEVIGALDAARAEDDPDAAASALDQARSLVCPPDPETAFGRLYLQALQDHPEVVFAHRDVTLALG